MNVKQQTKDIIDRIDRLFGDTSVSQQVTLACLEEIESDIQSKIGALEADIKMGRETE